MTDRSPGRARELDGRAQTRPESTADSPLSSNTDEPSPRALYLRLLRQVLPYWRGFALALLAMVLLAGTEPAMPALLERVVGGFENNDVSGIPLLALALVVLFMIRGIAAYGSAVALASVASKLVRDLRAAMFDKLLAMPMAEYDEQETGRLISKVTYDAQQVTEAATRVVTIIVRDSLAILGLLAWMLFIDWQLTLVAFITAPPVAFTVRYFSRRLRRASRGIQDTMGEVTHVAEEAVGGAKVIRAFGAQDYERERMSGVINRSRVLQVKFASAATANAPLAQFITAIALAVIIYIAAGRFSEGAITLASFVSFFTAMAMLFSPLKRLIGVNGHLQRGLAAAHSVFELIDRDSETDTGTKELGRATGQLSFEGVSFAYHPGRGAALEEVSLEVMAGETVALVGPSGSGKTTLANLIPRFYEPTSGQIRLDGVDLRELSLSSLRLQIALVSQEVVLFNDSIAANITYGNPNRYSPEAIEAAARAAHAHDFIIALPDGYATQAGERGSRLSGGQRQRIALARAFLKDAPILIMDEATSALDSVTEMHVREALADLSRNRTTLVIAHRLSTVENADRIAVMTAGRIVDIGQHHALLERNSLYAGLYHFQRSRVGPEPISAAETAGPHSELHVSDTGERDSQRRM